MGFFSTVGTFVQKGRNAVVRNMPKVCACVAVTGVFTTAALAVWKTPEAMRLIRERNARTKKEKVNAAWKSYIPATASAAITVAAIITGHSIQLQRYGELAAAYGLSQTVMHLYYSKVRKEVGDQREAELRAESGAEAIRMREVPVQKLIPLDTTSPIDPNDVKNPCFDYYGGRDFEATRNEIRKSIDTFNEGVLKVNGYGCMNDLYLCFHKPELKETGFGSLLGWNLDRDGEVIPMITADLDKNGNVCMVLDFYNPPQYDFIP